MNGITLPTRSSPRIVVESQLATLQDSYLNNVKRVVGDFRQRVRLALHRAQAQSDSSVQYQIVYAQCPLATGERRLVIARDVAGTLADRS